MAQKARVNGAVCRIIGGKCRVNGVVYELQKGRTRLGGAVYDIRLTEELCFTAYHAQQGGTLTLTINGTDHVVTGSSAARDVFSVTAGDSVTVTLQNPSARVMDFRFNGTRVLYAQKTSASYSFPAGKNTTISKEVSGAIFKVLITEEE